MSDDDDQARNQPLIPAGLHRPPTPIGGREIAVPIPGGGDMEVFIPDASRDRVRRQFLRRSRAVGRRSMVAANQATLAYTLGGGIGGTLATGGIVAIATGSGAVSLAGLAVTAIGAALTSVGIFVAHRVSNIRARYEEEVGILRDAAEELR